MMLNRSRTVAIAAVALAVFAPRARAGWHPSAASFDTFAFAQQDRGGQAYKAEGLRYLGARSAVDLLVDGLTTLRTTVAVSFVANEDAARVPNVDSITSASSRLVALDAAVGLERRIGERWVLRPGIFYHHQNGYIGEGVDVAVDRNFADGDATLSASAHMRVSFLDLDTWYGESGGNELQATNAFGLSWRQNLSPSVVAQIGGQYTRQDGYLGDSFNYVVILAGTTPVAATDETLPDVRHRGQVNGRLRWSPAPGAAGGVDASYYVDNWGVHHVAAEPNLTLPLPGTATVRTWWRVSSQDAARYYAARVTTLAHFHTQDSDLGEFAMNSAGMSLTVPRGGRALPDELELSVYGFTRDDGIRAGGANAGFRRRW